MTLKQREKERTQGEVTQQIYWVPISTGQGTVPGAWDKTGKKNRHYLSPHGTIYRECKLGVYYLDICLIFKDKWWWSSFSASFSFRFSSFFPFKLFYLFQNISILTCSYVSFLSLKAYTHIVLMHLTPWLVLSYLFRGLCLPLEAPECKLLENRALILIIVYSCI